MHYEDGRTSPLTIKDLWNEVRRRLGSFSTEGVWIRGTIRDFKYSQHVYMSLEESSGSDPKPRVSVRIWGQNAQRILAELKLRGLPALADGLSLVAHGRLDPYLPRGTISFVLDAIDYEALREEARKEVDRIRHALQKEGIYHANRQLYVSAVPLRIALVTSGAGTVQFDFGKLLAESGYAFSTTLVPTPVTGEHAGELVASAIRYASGLDVDLVVVVRGGGAQSELAVFDSEPVVRAVATSAKPVWCAIGHAADEVLINEVANRAFDVPQSAARAVVDRVGEYLRAFGETVKRARALALNRLDQQRAGFDRIRLRVGERADQACRVEARKLTALEVELSHRAKNRIDASTGGVQIQRRILAVKAAAAIARIDAATPAVAALRATAERRAEGSRRDIEAIGMLLQAKDPESVLARGYAILATGEGSWIRSRSALLAEQEIEAVMHDGKVNLRLAARGGE